VQASTTRPRIVVDLARSDPKTLCYRLLHVAARLTRGQRRLWVRIQQIRPWTTQLAAAFAPAPRTARPDRLTRPQTHSTAGAPGITANRTPQHAQKHNQAGSRGCPEARGTSLRAR
jgi:hypothetical protein